jgi:phosphoribosyl-ATP pyrophosphohydrolase/phosphoribosyl-AMP cyclohydrolase
MQMNLDFDKLGGLIPAVIQDNVTGKVLMLGFMNEESYRKTLEIGKVTFFSRSRQKLWTKGETSGNFLHVVSMANDCDHDTLLIKVNPIGPVCHKGTDTCWAEENKADFSPLSFIEKAVLDKASLKKAESAKTEKLQEFADHLENMMKSLASDGLEIKDVVECLSHKYIQRKK